MQWRKNALWDCCLIHFSVSSLMWLKRGCRKNHWSGEAKQELLRRFSSKMEGELDCCGERSGAVFKNFLLKSAKGIAFLLGESWGMDA